MKDAQFTVVFVTHSLANGTGPNGGRDMFQRDHNNNIVMGQSGWYSAFAQGIDLARVRGIKPGDIHMNLSVSAPTEVYERRYGDAKMRKHEAIMPGTKVTFEAVVSDHVTQSNLRQILERIGKYVGLSAYGFRLGYGHFSVLEVIVAASEGAASEPDNQ